MMATSDDVKTSYVQHLAWTKCEKCVNTKSFHCHHAICHPFHSAWSHLDSVFFLLVLRLYALVPANFWNSLGSHSTIQSVYNIVLRYWVSEHVAHIRINIFRQMRFYFFVRLHLAMRSPDAICMNFCFFAMLLGECLDYSLAIKTQQQQQRKRNAREPIKMRHKQRHSVCSQNFSCFELNFAFSVKVSEQTSPSISSFVSPIEISFQFKMVIEG